jgi:hypothetical protein
MLDASTERLVGQTCHLDGGHQAANVEERPVEGILASRTNRGLNNRSSGRD